MNKNLPISELNLHKPIVHNEASTPPTINRKMFFPVALEGGTDAQGNGTFTTKKVNWVDLFRGYAYSQQNISDLLNILQKYDLYYNTYYDETPIEIINGKIDLKPVLKQEFYDKSEIDELLTRYDDSSKIDELVKIRTSYDIKYIEDDDAEGVLFINGLLDYDVSLYNFTNEIEENLYGNKAKNLIITIKHKINTNLFNNTIPNVKLYEKNIDFNIYQDNYIETLVEVISQKEISISNGMLDIKLHFGLTNSFEGKLIIN